jgi:hypothetical protein
MDDLESLIARAEAGESISFGPHIALTSGALHLPEGSLPMNTLQSLRLDADGNVEVRRLGRDLPPILVPAAEVEVVDRLIRLANHLIQAIPYVKRRSSSGWPPGSIGDISARIGTDVRELLIAGYTHEQIQSVLRGEFTLDELYEQRPKGKRMTLRRSSAR